MRVRADPRSQDHDPPLFFRRGRTIDHPEQPERYRVLEAAVRGAGHEVRAPQDHGLDILRGVQDPDYVAFLRTAWELRGELDPGAEELLTTQFARPQMHRRPPSLAGRLGYHAADTSTPIREGTWRAVWASAQAAASAADDAAMHGAAYALCRPPGHHAYADCAGGFCFLNNTAVAAQRLRTGGAARVAILDVDVHHGNGTQGIFWRRGDVLTVSLHADPGAYFPFYAGYADEIGAGAGEGFNLNLPLAHGGGDVAFLAAVGAGLRGIEAFAPDALVVALGLDAAADDPLGVLNVTSEGFARAGAAIAGLRRPTALVQEGGYLQPGLGANLLAFLEGFEGA